MADLTQSVNDTANVTDPGTTELAGPIRVSESVTRLLALSVLLFESVTVANPATTSLPLTVSVSESVVVTDEASFVTPLTQSVFDTATVTELVSRSSYDLSLTQSVGDDLGVSSGGSSNLSGPIRVSEYVNVYISLGGGGLTRAVVDECIVGDVPNPFDLSTAQTETISAYDDVGQDYPIVVRESVTVNLSTVTGITTQFDTIAVTESVSPQLYDTALDRRLSESVAVTESTTRDLPETRSVGDDIGITEATASGGSIISLTASAPDDVAVTDAVSRTLTPIKASTSNSSIVTDRAVGYLTAPMPIGRALTSTIPVTEAVTAKYSALAVQVVDTIAVRELVRSRGAESDSTQDQYQFRFRYQL